MSFPDELRHKFKKAIGGLSGKTNPTDPLQQAIGSLMVQANNLPTDPFRELKKITQQTNKMVSGGLMSLSRTTGITPQRDPVQEQEQVGREQEPNEVGLEYSFSGAIEKYDYPNMVEAGQRIKFRIAQSWVLSDPEGERVDVYAILKRLEDTGERTQLAHQTKIIDAKGQYIAFPVLSTEQIEGGGRYVVEFYIYFDNDWVKLHEVQFEVLTPTESTGNTVENDSTVEEPSNGEEEGNEGFSFPAFPPDLSELELPFFGNTSGTSGTSGKRGTSASTRSQSTIKTRKKAFVAYRHRLAEPEPKRGSTRAQSVSPNRKQKPRGATLI